MGAGKERWVRTPNGPDAAGDSQTLLDIRDLLLIIGQAVTLPDNFGRSHARGLLVRFIEKRRETVPGDGH